MRGLAFPVLATKRSQGALQWQTVAEAKAKDKRDRKECGK